MNNPLIWDIYEISSQQVITGIMLRSRVRNFCLEHDITLIIENARDKENTVRFAVLENQNIIIIKEYLDTILETFSIKKVLIIKNPILSNLYLN